jgi:flavodoxin
VNVAVLYQSLRGGTERAAHRIGEAFEAHNATVGVYPVTQFDAQFVLKADLIVIGTWTDGLFGIAAKPAQIGKLNTLPSIAHRNVAVFVTYEISPKRSLAGLVEWATERGAEVVATAGLRVRGPRRPDLAEATATFAEAAIDALSRSAV